MWYFLYLWNIQQPPNPRDIFYTHEIFNNQQILVILYIWNIEQPTSSRDIFYTYEIFNNQLILVIFPILILMKYSITYFYSDSDIKLKDAIKFHNFTMFAEHLLYILGNCFHYIIWHIVEALHCCRQAKCSSQVVL